jgi:hypothetical protein
MKVSPECSASTQSGFTCPHGIAPRLSAAGSAGCWDTGGNGALVVVVVVVVDDVVVLLVEVVPSVEDVGAAVDEVVPGSLVEVSGAPVSGAEVAALVSEASEAAVVPKGESFPPQAARASATTAEMIRIRRMCTSASLRAAVQGTISTGQGA